MNNNFINFNYFLNIILFDANHFTISSSRFEISKYRKILYIITLKFRRNRKERKKKTKEKKNKRRLIPKFKKDGRVTVKRSDRNQNKFSVKIA